MGRPRGFQADDVIAAAMACFREFGYEATSIRDLEAVTGLKAPSIYKAFGDKAAFFAAVLARYEQDVLLRRVDTYLQPASGIEGIRAFFVSTHTVEPAPTHGCLLANSAIEYHALDAQARLIVDAGLRRLRAAFSEVIVAEQQRGTIAATVDAKQAALVLVTLYEGQLLLQRTVQPFAEARTTIDTALAALLPPPSPTATPPINVKDQR
jgi:TetR/AcrR family transcriptional regulator, transcriptional repressor for nem operon